MSRLFILEGHKPVEEHDLLTWSLWMEGSIDRRIVARTESEFLVVSTVFLGLDHRCDDKGPPILFETMAFERQSSFGESLEQARYSAWDDAETGHKAIVRRLMKAHAR